MKNFVFACMLFVLMGGVSAQAGLAERARVSGVVLAWDSKAITLFSKGYETRVPRSAYKGRLKKGDFLRVSYPFKDHPSYKSFVKALRKAKVPRKWSSRQPASKK